MTDLRQEARGSPCQVRVPSICCAGTATVILAHVRMAGLCGIGLKSNDLHAAWCCDRCHDAIDGRTKTPYTKLELRVWHLEGVLRTQAELIKRGMLK